MDVGAVLMDLAIPEERRLDPSSVATTVEAAGEELSARDRALLCAASALAAGEAKRAACCLRALDAHDPVAAAMRAATFTTDRNWFPGGGGAVLEAGDEDVPELPDRPREPGEAALILVYGRVTAAVPTWRAIAHGAARHGRADAVRLMMGQVRGPREEAEALGLERVVAYLALIEAELSRLSGAYDQAKETWNWAVEAYEAVDDSSGVALCALRLGDWALAPFSSPDVLNLDLETSLRRSPPQSLEAASRAYGAAHDAFLRARSRRGLAAIAVRHGWLAFQMGQANQWAASLAQAAEHIHGTGDTACELLIATHQAVAVVADGRVERDETLPARVGEWAQTVGSTSYARGLARLLHAQSREWRQKGEFVRARTVLRSAEAMASASGGQLEPELVGRELAELYGATTYPLAALVLGLLEIDEALAAAAETAPMEGLTWIELANRAMSAMNAAVRAADASAIRGAAARIRELLRRPPEALETPDPSEIDREPTLEQASVLVPLYQAREARLAGREGEAAALFDEALEAAKKVGHRAFLTAVVLGTAGREAEARPLVKALVDRGELPPDIAVDLLLRVGLPEHAAALLPEEPLLDEDRPWVALAQWAEVLASTGRSDEAYAAAVLGIERFEKWLIRFQRDSLKLSGADDQVVAGLYSTAIRVDLERAAAGDEAAAATAFMRADRARPLALTDDADVPRGSVLDVAIRRWQRNGSRWAATYEQLAEDFRAGRPVHSVTARRQLAEAEAELDDAEAAVERASPGYLTRARTPPPPPRLETVARSLPEGSLLVQYYAFDQDLIIWTLVSGRLQPHRRSVRWADLAGRVRRFHHACAGLTGADSVLSADLARLLLGPIADELRDHRRIVVVPDGGLALLPFHLLPFEGDVLGASRLISVLPASSSAPRLATEGRLVRIRPAVIVGDPDYGAHRRLSRLPGAATEAASIANLLGERPLRDSAATQAAVAAAVPGCRVLHLATHGLLDERGPNRSALALAGDDELTVADLMGLDLDADLVVLSACDTGRGRATLGGDVVGLTRAVLIAGARNVVVSLWPVDDAAACVLMTHLYQNLIKHPEVSTALAAAASTVRTLGRRGVAATYDAQRLDAGTAGATGRRDLLPEGGTPLASGGPDDAALWGPFIHIGL
jgi:CHAT domain-containing protein